MIRLKPTLTCILVIYFVDIIQGLDLDELDEIGDRPQHEDSIIANKLSLLVKRLILDNYKTGQLEHDRKKLVQFEYDRKKPTQFQYYRKKPLPNPRLFTNKESLTKKWISRGKIPQFENDRERINPVISTNEVSLVKRLVPKRYKTPQFEYDRKLKSVFVPKYRVHRERDINNGKVFTELYELFFKPMFVRNPGISKQARQIGRNSLRVNTGYDPEILKTNRPQWGQEDDSKKKSEFNFPHFSLYNFWTYDKSLLHDLCPPHQAQLGNHCIYAPMATLN